MVEESCIEMLCALLKTTSDRTLLLVALQGLENFLSYNGVFKLHSKLPDKIKENDEKAASLSQEVREKSLNIVLDVGVPSLDKLIKARK